MHRIEKDKKKNELLEEVEELSGENLYACYQCGTCTAGCPFTEEMDISPDTVIRYVILGREDEVLNSKTIWLCASCFTCAERCPRDLDLTRIMEALRTILLRKKQDHVSVDECKDVVEEEEIPQLALVSVFRKSTG